MGLLSRIVPRRRRTRFATGMFLVVAVVVVGWATYAGTRPGQVPDPPVLSAAEVEAQQRAADATKPPQTTGDEFPDASTAAKPARVPDIPLAWQRISAQARAWPPATASPALGEEVALPTVPASRVRDTIGLNIDTWRTEAGYRDFGPVLAKVAELQLRHARVNMSATGGAWGLSRLQQLGKIGVRLDLVMGDAFGRYGTAPYGELDRRLDRAVMPYVDSLEGSNEPDLAKEDDWPAAAREHQEQVVQSASTRRGDPVAVVAPSLGRIANLPQLGSYGALADAGNAHAYSSAEEPSAPMDEWLAALKATMPGGAPAVITEAGFNDDLRQTKYHSPLPQEIAADYVPRTILEAMRRGIPRVYLYEMINRWSDPFHIDTAAHFGLLDHELRPKPAWNALLRLQRALLDGGRPDRAVPPLRVTVVAGPDDVRLLGFRRQDGTAAIAIWRAVSEWDSQAQRTRDYGQEAVVVKVDGSVDGALVTNLSTAERGRVSGADSILSLDVDGGAYIVDGIRPG